jgi:imidazolonepropionase-like amidohydrolase
MRMTVLLGLVCAASLAVTPRALPHPAAPTSPRFVAFTNANVIDGLSDRPVRNATVTVRDGRILSVSTVPANLPEGMTVVDLKGRWVLPGLIDAHVHVDPDSARVALESGVTTVRTGTGGLDVRDRHRGGDAALPDVLASDTQVRRQPAAAFFQDVANLADLRGGLRGAEDVRRMVGALVARGVDVIKIMATERAGLPEADPRRRVFSDEELLAAVDAATRAGRAVMAHAHGDDGGAGAVRAGARSIEHGTYLSDATLSLMKKRGTFLVPTVTVLARYAATNGPRGDSVAVAERSRDMLPLLRAVTTKAYRMGVRIVAGSDSSYRDEFRLQSELTELVAAGLSPFEAIKASTSVAAECLRIETRTGAIKPDLEADLIVVDRDPTADIGALRDVVLVLNNGRIAVNRLRR